MITKAKLISDALHGIPNGRGFLCRCPMPGHGKGNGDRNPSLSIADGQHRLLVNCFAGCDPKDILAELRRLGLLSGETTRERSFNRPLPPPTKNNPECHPNFGIAQRLWSESVSLIGSLGEHYLRVHREINLDLIPDLSHCLRYHLGSQAMIALMTDPVTNAPLGVHRTFLNGDGSNRGNAEGKNDKRMLGPAGVIRLSPDEAVTKSLVIGEGIETTLSAMILPGRSLRPAWAAGTVGGIKRFPVLERIEHLTILLDNDPNGVSDRDARFCGQRWLEAGRACELLLPPEKDFNDIIRKAR